MFKVHENGDGSTSIFCSKTGKLICKIGKQQKNMGLGYRPVNVIEPSPKNRSCCFNVEPKEESEDLNVGSNEQAEIKQEECDLPTWDEPDEDFSAEAITSEDFARCLNLVSTEKFRTQPINDLRTIFPLRLLSRTKALTSDVKFPEELPVTSSVGLKVLKANEQKNIYCDQTVEMRIKSYETFCRFQINSFSHPNLRCRDKRDYPICYSSKNAKFNTTHRYTFNRAQRLENLITIKTGLDTRSRKLLLRCNKRLAVSIERLPDEEIKYWMQKRARLGPIPADLIRGEDSSLMGSDSDATVIDQNSSTYVDIDLCSDESSEPSDNDDPTYSCKSVRKKSNFQGVFGSNSSALRNRNGQSPKLLLSCFEKYRDSWVVLNNVLDGIWKCRGEYYVVGTNIKVPFLKDYLNSLDTKTRNSLVFPEANLIINPRYDHAYHRPFSTIADRKRNLFPNSNCLNHKNSKTKVDFKNSLKGSSPAKNKSLKSDSVKSSNSLKPNMNEAIAEVVVIPIIDLTASPPNSPIKNPKGNCSFHCFGCGYNIKSQKVLEAKLLAAQHLQNFHCVSDPQSFLNVNSTPSGIVMEAFPGYKKDSLG